MICSTPRDIIPATVQNITDIDKLLPQTQCELCEYPGCLPYAQAMVNDGERIDRCLPGGVETLRALGKALGQDPEPFVAEMTAKAKLPAVAVIREDICIGCTKCIKACPVDAIIGAAKQMHTIISDACTGCELCLPPCPVDCIDIIPIDSPDDVTRQQFADQSRQRYQQHQARLAKQPDLAPTPEVPPIDTRQQAIAEALARVKQKGQKNNGD